MSKTNSHELKGVSIDNNSTLVCDYSIDGKSQKTILEYKDIDFTLLEKTFGIPFIRFVCVHIAVFEGFKYTSLFPEYYDLYGFEEYITEELLSLFSIIQDKVFAQHRFENSNPDYSGPLFRYATDVLKENISSVSLSQTNNEALVSCGGGKDSLLCMELLNSIDIPFSTIQYSHTIYGEANFQNEMISKLSKSCNCNRIHVLNNIETFMDGKILDEYDDINTLCNAETPNGVFQCILYCLQYGYKYLIVGHENSADDPNFIWKITENRSEPVNHQWGKSLEAEILLCQYIKKYFCNDIHFFSILKPINDFLIMKTLKPYEKLLSLTHSCNIKKPWCKKCPKCAYVWICFLAYFDENTINDIFGENPFNKPELQEIFLELMGSKGHKPFECIGEIDETKLALYFCVQKGMKGMALTHFSDKILNSMNIMSILQKYNQVSEKHNIPNEMASKIIQQFQQAKRKAEIEYPIN